MSSNEDRCDFSELPPDQCAHCRKSPAIDKPPKPELGGLKTAEYHGVCPVCETKIKPGEDVIGIIEEEGHPNHGEWAHYGCGR